MIDYFDVYQAILRTIRDKTPRNAYELFYLLSKDQFFKDQLVSGVPNKVLTDYTLETVENLINDNLVKGEIIESKNGIIYSFKGLSTLGHQYLLSLEKPELKDKLKASLKEEGIPVTPGSISKFIAKLLW